MFVVKGVIHIANVVCLSFVHLLLQFKANFWKHFINHFHSLLKLTFYNLLIFYCFLLFFLFHWCCI